VFLQSKHKNNLNRFNIKVIIHTSIFLEHVIIRVSNMIHQAFEKCWNLSFILHCIICFASI